MNLKRFMLAMAGVAMLAAVMASSAMAAAEPGGVWYVNGKQLSGSETVNCSAAGTLKLEGSVGSEGEVPVTLTATGIECVEATVFNNEAGTLGEDAGRLRFTGVTVDSPPNCSVSGGTVTTQNLKSSLAMDSSNPAITFDKFEPAATNFAVVKITGATCAVSGNRYVRGYVYGQASNLTEEPAATQPLNFSSSIDATAGSALEFAANPAHLTGTVNNTLASGAEFEARP